MLTYKNNSKLRDAYIIQNIKNSSTEYPKLSEIGGITYLLPTIKEKLWTPLFCYESYKTLNTKPPTTLLIHGVAGIGKSFLLRAICQEYGINYIRAETTNEKALRESFRSAELVTPAIVAIDALDTYTQENDRKILAEMAECIEAVGPRVLVVAIARSFVDIESGISRFFKSHLSLRIPSLKQRIEILSAMTKGLNQKGIDFEKLALITPGFVANDLMNLIKQAATKAINRNGECIIQDDYEAVLQEIRSRHSGITFENIGALDEVKRELEMSILLPSRYPHKFHRLGIKRPSGILLYGPPGCGKTMLARAVSNMSHCNFIAVKGPELISKYVGDSEKAIRKLFEDARQKQPCVLFFDEIDSLCSSRGETEFGNRVVNQLLTLLDGLSERGEVYIIGATNRISAIDRAILRPGRFDKSIEVPLPGPEERIVILSKLLKEIPMCPFDLTTLNLEGFSGADISGIVKEGALLALKENFENDEILLEEKHLRMAIHKIRELKMNYENH
ncbi:Transitional endoplasmic reticulum ATPase [Astathelohania contejeani]|uniref:Transitional endoplasmic reticulum ATPase n=1 Tax=Astathelohania contejeani TaxID=164912 RepID=A0ABQ7I2A5_9MICR|nr:Transitional endoplasmic reticulum ATPase [Thelohania contejeani]